MVQFFTGMQNIQKCFQSLKENKNQRLKAGFQVLNLCTQQVFLCLYISSRSSEFHSVNGK